MFGEIWFFEMAPMLSWKGLMVGVSRCLIHSNGLQKKPTTVKMDSTPELFQESSNHNGWLDFGDRNYENKAWICYLWGRL
jgi:hypothetical protein